MFATLNAPPCFVRRAACPSIQQGKRPVAGPKCCVMFPVRYLAWTDVKLNLQSIIILVVLGFIVKSCGGDGAPRTGKGSNVGRAEISAPAPVAPTPATPQTKTRYIGPQSLNVRSSPNGSVVGSLRRGSAVEIHGEDAGWSRISADDQPQQWVSSSYLCVQHDCGDMPKWKKAPIVPATPVPQRRTAPSPSSTYGCPCSSGNNCFGPRGGRYCITSGGNKRYR